MSLIIAALANLLPDELPSEIVYIPEGSHAIHPTVNGKPQAITVKLPAERGEAIAAAFQSDLVALQKHNVRPIIDFDHKNVGPAAAIPQAFRYEPGKGLMCAVEWTGAGKSAIAGKDFSYFSPTFLLGDDNVPAGLPERGPLGALVNNPAFREIPRIAAADATEHESKETTPMSKLIFAALTISAAAEDAETAAVQAIEGLKTKVSTVEAKNAELETEKGDLKTKLEAAQAEVAKSRKDRADSLIEAAIAEGVPPKLEILDELRSRIEAGDTLAEKMLAALPRDKKDIDKSIVKAGEGKGEKKDEPKGLDLVAAALADESK